MAMLDREKFFERIKERLGEDDSDEALSFLEDVTDTYDDLERRAAGDGEDWKGKYRYGGNVSVSLPLLFRFNRISVSKAVPPARWAP